MTAHDPAERRAARRWQGDADPRIRPPRRIVTSQARRAPAAPEPVSERFDRFGLLLFALLALLAFVAILAELVR